MSTAKTLTDYSAEEDVFSFSNADAEVVLAHIADFGDGGANETLVRDLVYGWKPDAIFTSGDNSYANYAADVDAFYGEYVDRDLLWPCPGNHDWDDGTLAAYFSYFYDVTGTRYYYKKTFGPVSLFMLDSDTETPDGTTIYDAQYEWFARDIQASRSPWNIVSFHHPPYTSSSSHAATTGMRWGFGDLGADLVLNGHNHQYERLYEDTHYIVNGAGGRPLYGFTTPVSQSIVRYSDMHGAGKLIATPTKLRWEWRNYLGALIDSLEVEHE
jgi:tartrate-resistant acid phosphatase type 5